MEEILDATQVKEVKEAAEVSMGTEVGTDDLMNMKILADQIIEMTNYRFPFTPCLALHLILIHTMVSVITIANATSFYFQYFWSPKLVF